MEKIQILCQLTLLHQQSRKRKPNIDDITNRHCHLSQLPAILVPMRNRITIGLKLSLKMTNLNGNYPKVWPTTQTNILKSKIQRSVSLKEAILCQNPVPDNLDNVKKLDDFLRDILKEKVKQANKISKMF